MANDQSILELDAFDFNDELFSGGLENFVFHNINVGPILENAGLNPNCNVTRYNNELFNKQALQCDPEFDERRKNEWNRHKQTSTQYQSIRKESQRLPIYAENILERVIKKIEEKPNCMICLNGINASGKTTQLPQALLNDAIEKGRASLTFILVALPTNFAVWALAQRVAQERDEKIGFEVGYKISGDQVLPHKQGSILFLTYNTLRLWLEHNQNVNSVSHLILDEVDERDKNVDKCIRLVEVNKIPRKLKVIQISTGGYYRDIERYFSDFDTYAFDVRMEEPKLNFHYIADVIEALKFKLPERVSPLDFKQRRMSYHCPEVTIDPGIIDALLAMGCYSADTITTMRNWDLTKYPGLEMKLITQLTIHLCQQMDACNTPRGNILIYMAEYEAIKHIYSNIKYLKDNIFRPYDVIFVHSQMKMKYLQKIFEPSVNQKIIIASNIIEISVTIPEVRHVIDCGMTKMQIFDSDKNIEYFQPYLSARSNAINRARAAGRTSSGSCHVYRIYTEYTFTDIMTQYHKPELGRISLSTELLELKLTSNVPLDYYQSLPTSPEEETLHLAAKELVEIDLAIPDHPGPLTQLGRLASKLVSTAGDLRYAKMLIMGVVMCCVKPIVTIVAVLSLTDPFRIMFDQGIDQLNNQTVAKEIEEIEAQIRIHRKRFARGSHSDHFMTLNIIEEYLSLESDQIRELWAKNHFIDEIVMEKIVEKKANLISGLKSAHILPNNYHDNNRSWFDEKSSNKAIIRAVICRALGTSKIALNLRKEKKFTIATHLGTAEARIHYGSVNHCSCQRWYDCDCGNSRPQYLLFGHVYYTETKVPSHSRSPSTANPCSTTINLRETTAVGPLTIMLFGARILIYNHENHFLQADGFRFRCDELKARQIMDAKESLEVLIQKQIALLTQRPNVSHGWRHLRTVFERLSEENDWICSRYLDV